MKKSILAIVILAFAVHAVAQDSSLNNEAIAYKGGTKKNADNGGYTLDKKVIWSAGIEPSIPVGHFHDFTSFGFGASLQGEIKAGTHVGITINAGYISYSGRTVDTISYPNFNYWPVMGGLKLYMGKAYLHGQAGAGFGTQSLGSSFWYGAGIGVNFTKRIDGEFRYAGWKQNEVGSESSTGGIYGGGTGGGTGGGGIYGGHYSTLGLRLAVNF